MRRIMAGEATPAQIAAFVVALRSKGETSAEVSRCLHEAGIGFMFAPVFHAAMAHAGGPRKEMGIPTVFNFLGPLSNPARPTAQVVGVSNEAMLPVMAGVLAERGTRSYLFRGSDGLDELTTTGPSTVFETRDGNVETYELDPASLGVPRASMQDLIGGDPQHNAGVVKGLLVGEPGPARDIVVVNAGLALSAWG